MSGGGATDGDTAEAWEALGPGQAASFFHPRPVAWVMGAMETREVCVGAGWGGG